MQVRIYPSIAAHLVTSFAHPDSWCYPLSLSIFSHPRDRYMRANLAPTLIEAAGDLRSPQWPVHASRFTVRFTRFY